MMKRWLVAGALALSINLWCVRDARADPVSTAIVTALSLTGTAAAVATFVINTALYSIGTWAVGKAAQALGLVKQNIAERQAQVTTLSLGEGPREFLFGLACTGGWMIDAFNWGGKYGTDNTTRCIGLADHACDAIVGYYVDDTFYEWTGSGVQPGFGGALRIDFVNATANGTPPPDYAITATAGADDAWTASDVMAGVTRVWVTTKFEDKVWTQGHPRLKFVLRGLRLYDPRKDARFGYTGPNPHVWEDPSTHQWSRNAVLGAYNFRRGIFVTGRQGQLEHLLGGRGLSEVEAPPQRIIAAANVCDELVNSRIRYAADGVIYSSQQFIEIEELFAAACAGVIVSREGGVEIEPGQAKATAVEITDGDLVSGQPVIFNTFLPDTEGGRINTVVPRYIEPDQGWKDHSGPVRRIHADIIADRGPRELTLSLPLVTDGDQADACAIIARRKGRLEKRARIVLPPRFAGLEDGDWVGWTSARRHKGQRVVYRVSSWGLGEEWRMQLALEEIASSVFGQEDPLADLVPPPPPPMVIDALSLDGVLAESITLAGTVSAIPAIRYHWDTPVDPAIEAIRAEIRIKGETEIATKRIDNVASGVEPVTEGVTPDRILETRLVPIGPTWRPVQPSPWQEVSTGTVLAGDLAPGAPTAILAAQHTDLIAAEMLRGSLYRSYTDGLLHLEGQPVATLFQQLSDQVVDDLGSFAGTLTLLGAKNTAGTGFNIAADSVFLPAAGGGGQVQSLRSLQLTTAANTQEIQQLLTLTDGFASSSTLLVVNDVITGIVNQNDGSTGSLLFQADVFAFADPNGGVVTYPFSYGVDNILRLTDVIVHGDLVVEGTLTNKALVRNTITGLVVADTQGVVTLTGTTAKMVQELWISVQNDGSPVKVMFSGLVLMLHNPSGSFSAVFELRRATDNGQGVSRRTWEVGATGDTYDAVAGTYTFHLQDDPGPGNWRYFFTIRSTVSNMTIQQVTDPYMEAIEYRNNEV